jgi:iron(II)-dependent oxidoreductase
MNDTLTAAPDQAAFKSRALAALDAARRVTLDLAVRFDEDDLCAQHSPLMSPLVWDLAHIANVEDRHIVRDAGGRAGVRPDVDDLYDAYAHPRADRPGLPLLSPAEARAYLAEVRQQAEGVIASLDLDADARRLLLFVAQHEHQHDETMLATVQLRQGDPVLSAAPPGPAGTAGLPAEVPVEGGPFAMGGDDAWALDNERPVHDTDVRPFWIDTAPVANAQYRRFIEDGGYDDPRWWSPEGWDHRTEAGLQHPQFWERDGDTWARRSFGRTEPLADDTPVAHVCWYEADAYARWAGRRLPTEAEWEKAARWDAATGTSLRYPWGDDEPDASRANFGRRHLGPAPAGSFPLGASPCGARQMLGDVWEWTASAFDGYPGFRPFPYEEYSSAFFDGRSRVLRGGSFATHPDACRAAFRNWDFPIRRQIFAGFRTARDAD